MPKPKATPAQVREVLIAANCIRYDSASKAHVPNASEAARRTSCTQGYWWHLMDDNSSHTITVARLREHAATLGLTQERIDQILPPNDGN